MINAKKKKKGFERLRSWSSTTVQAKNKLNSHLIISYMYIFQKTYKVVLQYFYKLQ